MSSNYNVASHMLKLSWEQEAWKASVLFFVNRSTFFFPREGLKPFHLLECSLLFVSMQLKEIRFDTKPGSRPSAKFRGMSPEASATWG